MTHELATGMMLTGAVVWAAWIVGMVCGTVASVRAGMRLRRLRRPVPPAHPGLRMMDGGRR